MFIINKYNELYAFTLNSFQTTVILILLINVYQFWPML